MRRMYFVLLGDVVGSRRIKSPEKFQEKLDRLSSIVNSRFADQIYAPLEIIKGKDEIGMVLRGFKDVYKIISLAHDLLSPESIRFVLVYGLIDTGLPGKIVSRLDGPAFHKASKLMVDFKKAKLFFKMEVFDSLIDALVSSLVNAILLRKNSWTDRQIVAVNYIDDKKTQENVARELGISQQAISDRLRTANWKELKAIENELDNLLSVYAKRCAETTPTGALE